MTYLIHTLNGTVTDLAGLTYSVGESVSDAGRHANNLAYYTDPAKFRSWDLLEYHFDEFDNVTAQTHRKR